METIDLGEKQDEKPIVSFEWMVLGDESLEGGTDFQGCDIENSLQSDWQWWRRKRDRREYAWY